MTSHYSLDSGYYFLGGCSLLDNILLQLRDYYELLTNHLISFILSLVQNLSFQQKYRAFTMKRQATMEFTSPDLYLEILLTIFHCFFLLDYIMSSKLSPKFHAWLSITQVWRWFKKYVQTSSIIIYVTFASDQMLYKKNYTINIDFAELCFKSENYKLNMVLINCVRSWKFLTTTIFHVRTNCSQPYGASEGCEALDDRSGKGMGKRKMGKILAIQISSLYTVKTISSDITCSLKVFNYNFYFVFHSSS